MTHRFIPLANRHILTIEGEDAAHFLQGLITNDIHKVTDTQSIYALMLTPQGKYLYDFFISLWQGKYFLDAGTTNPEGLLKKLKMYKLRSKVEIALAQDYTALALIDGLGAGSDADAVYYPDPRNAALGARAIVKRISTWCSSKGLAQGETQDYEQLRFSLGVPDGVRDLIAEDSFPLPFGMEALHAVDFHKGCYVGQEVTARSKYRGSVKKGLCKVTADSPLPAYGTAIMAGTAKIGEILSSDGKMGLALVRNEDWEKAGEHGLLQADGVAVTLTLQTQ